MSTPPLQLKHSHAARDYRSPTYISWLSMRARTRNPNHSNYANYGGRGIVCCERWNDFRNFYIDMGPRPDGCSLDRIDVNGNYCPENCRWATLSEQRRNQRRVTNARD